MTTPVQHDPVKNEFVIINAQARSFLHSPIFLRKILRRPMVHFMRPLAAFAFRAMAAAMGLGVATSAVAAEKSAARQPERAQVVAANLPPVQKVRITLGGNTSIPTGWSDFCKRYAGECSHVDYQSPPQLIHLNAKMWKTLKSVNDTWNRIIVSASDIDHWGAIDQWDLVDASEGQDHRGDCEDFALSKRKTLIERYGVPATAVLVTVVQMNERELHAILVARTDRGDFVLDNMASEVLAWDQAYAPNKYVKQLSAYNEDEWRTITQPDSEIAGSLMESLDAPQAGKPFPSPVLPQRPLLKMILGKPDTRFGKH
jgi:predicted transglutaminase-like cysteine proteinase